MPFPKGLIIEHHCHPRFPYLVTCFTYLAIATLVAGTAATAQASLLFVGDATSTSIKRFDGTTGAFLDNHPLPDIFGNPAGMTIGPDGNLYVADNNSNAVDRFNGTTGVLIDQFIPSCIGSPMCDGLDKLSSPSNLTFGPGGDLYVANSAGSNTGFVNRYTSTGVFIDRFVSATSPLSATFAGLAFGPDNNLYVGDSVNGIDRFNGSTAAFDQFVPIGNPPSPLSQPNALRFDALGKLYVVDTTTSSVHLYSSAGAYLGDFIPVSGPLGQPIDGIFGPDGNFYVTDSQGVERFNGSGTSLGKFISAPDLTNAQFLAFNNVASVPEPSTIALLGAGIIGLALLLRRRSGYTSM